MEDQELIDRFIQERGITACPPGNAIRVKAARCRACDRIIQDFCLPCATKAKRAKAKAQAPPSRRCQDCRTPIIRGDRCPVCRKDAPARRTKGKCLTCGSITCSPKHERCIGCSRRMNNRKPPK